MRRSGWGRRLASALLACVLLAALLALAPEVVAPPAAEASTNPYVTNLDETATSDGGLSSSLTNLFNPFTTGGAATDRFRLDSLVVRVGSNADNMNVQIYSSDGSDPGAQIGSNLTQAGSATSGDLTYNASGITLRGATTYWLVLNHAGYGTGDPTVGRADTDDDDGTSGWSIGNKVWYYNWGASSYQPVWGESLFFRVNATPSTASRVVSNLGEADTSDSGLTGAFTIATSFATGGTTADAFPLDNARVHFDAGATASGVAVGIYTDSSGSPDSAIGADLVRHGSAARGDITFDAPASGITLYGGTTYWLVVTSPSGTDVRETSSDGQAGASGWAIGDTRHTLASGSWSQTSTRSIRFSVDATAAGPRTAVHLESNIGLQASSHNDSFLAHSFTTGAATGGYTLTGAQIYFREDSHNWSANTAVRIRRSTTSCGGAANVASCPGAGAGNLVATLPWVGNARGIVAATAPAGTTLSPNTTYWLTVNEGVSTSWPPRARVNRTSTDGSFGAPGWDLGDGGLQRTSEASNWTATSNNILFALKGYATPDTTVTLGVSPTTVTEGSTVTVTATLDAALASSVTIPITLTNGTAENGDYSALPSITITAGQTSNTGTITANEDDDLLDETFTVALGTLPTGLVAGSVTSKTVTIDDNDEAAVSLSVSPSIVTEGSSVTVTATLGRALGVDVVVPLTLTAGTAEPGDFGTLPSITVTKGSTSGTGTITTSEDDDLLDETFTVALGTLPTGLVRGAVPSRTVTIDDNDQAERGALGVQRTQARTTAGVSNLGQSDDGSVGFTTAGGYFANSFRVGGASSDRHTLSHVVFHFHSGGNGATVGIYEDSSGRPSTTRVGGNLTQVGSASSGQIRFNASGVTLNGDTTYWLRVYKGSTWNARQTQSNAEDGTSTDGWSIANVRYHSTNGTSWSTLPNSSPLRFSVSTTLPDTTPPTVHWARADGATVHVQFSEEMDTTSRAPNSAFTVLVEGVSRSVTGYTLSGNTATLTLASAVPRGQYVTVGYTRPDSGTVLQDVAGNDLESTGARVAVVLDGTVRVSNLEEDADTAGAINAATSEVFTSFTTGATHAATDIDYFVLDRVIVNTTGGARNLRVRIHSSRTGDPLEELVRSGNDQSGNIVFRAPTGAKRVVLQRNTTYWLALSRDTGQVFVGRTDSANQTNLRTSGWDIGDDVVPETGSAIWGESVRLAIDASVIWPPLAPRSGDLATSDGELQGSHKPSWVTNLARTKSGDEAIAAGAGLAARFRTGSGVPRNAGSYTLDEVTIDFASGDANATVAIHADSNGVPGAKVGSDLTRTSSDANGQTTYVAARGETITLNAATAYHVLVSRASGAGAVSVDTNTALTHAARVWGRSTRSSGWGIGNRLRTGTSGNWTTVAETPRLRVEATLTSSVPHAVVDTAAFGYAYGGINVPNTNASGAVMLVSNSFNLGGRSTDRFTLHAVDLALNGNTAYAQRVLILGDDGTGGPNLDVGEGGGYSEQVGAELVPRANHIHSHHLYWSLTDFAERTLLSYDQGGVRVTYEVPGAGTTLNGDTTYHLVVIPQASPVHPRSGRTFDPFLALPTVKTADALIGRRGAEVGHYEVSTNNSTTTAPFPGNDSAAQEVDRYSHSLKFAVRATSVRGAGGGGGGVSPRRTEQTQQPQVPGVPERPERELPPAFPAAPANLRAEAGDGQVTLSWDPILNYTGWEYELNDDGNWLDTGSDATTHTVTGLTNDTSYSFKVRPTLIVLSGDATGPVTATPRAPTPPGPVTNINVTHKGTSLEVTWTAPDGATGYDVTYYNTATRTNARAAWNRVGTTITITCDSRSGYENQNCVNTTGTYTVGVRARNTAGESAWANSAAASITAPGPVTGINVTHNGTSLEVSWTAPEGATHYDVTYYGDSTNARAAWNRAGTSLTISCDSRSGFENQNCVTSQHAYTVGVRARNAAGTGPWRNSATATHSG